MHRGATLREETTGITHSDASCILKTQHLRRLAAWASREARLSPFAAFLGRKFASEAESFRIPLDHPSAFLCERCETLLRPGINCSIRIEKFTTRRRSCRNKVVYQCHFCSHKNQTWGTAKARVPSPLASQQVQNPKLISCDSIDRLKDKCSKGIVISEELRHDAGRQNPSSEPKPSVLETGCSASLKVEGAASGNMTGTSSSRKRRRRQKRTVELEEDR